MSEIEKILVHICCSVDSHYFLQKLQKEYKEANLIGFFYDPNIHPYSEYQLRLLDVKRSCKMLNIELIEGDYDYDNWLESVRGLEDEPEKGKRCSVCFDRRFEVSAQKAKEIGAKYFTSTLLTSPKKSINQLKLSGDALAKANNIKFLAPDFRVKNGTQEQNLLAKKDKLYRQNYCGCLYGLIPQREQQNQLLVELFSSVNKQIMPNSIESKLELYNKRLDLEDKGITYEIVKQRFLNYRLLRGLVKTKKEVLNTYILPYSTIRNSFSRGRIDKVINGIGYFNRDEIKFITIDFLNDIFGSNFKNVSELLSKPLLFEDELMVRQKLIRQYYNLSAIFVVDALPKEKLEIYLDAKAYEDVKEELIELVK